MISGLEIFSGAGGLATGISMSGVNHKAFVEWNPDACKTLRANNNSNLIHEGDIRLFDFSPFRGIDLVAGGPPCQPFSMGGKAMGNLDERDMFPSAIRAIRELLPKAFLFENVKGLLRPNFKEYLNYILLQLRFPTIVGNGLGCGDHSRIIRTMASSVLENEQYDVQINLINAADYGIPQKRERVIIIGIRKDQHINWNFPQPTHSYDSLLWSKYVTSEYWDNHNISPSNSEFTTFAERKNVLLLKYGFFPPEKRPWLTIRDALRNIPSKTDSEIFKEEHAIRSGAKEYPGHTGSQLDEPSKTIKAGGHGVPGGENMIRFEDGSVRYMTVFEAKRIQTFPDSYHILGSWTEAMRQLGNAVPVQLAHTISKSLVQAIS